MNPVNPPSSQRFGRSYFTPRNLRKIALAAVSFSWLAAAAIAQDTNKPPATGALQSFTSGEMHGDCTISTLDKNGTLWFQAVFPEAGGNPGIEFPIPKGNWDLSGYQGTMIDVCNPGTTDLAVTLRVSNTGDWKLNPYSAQVINLEPGATKTLKVEFGKFFGGAGFALDPSKINGIRLFLNATKTTTVLQFINLKVYKGNDTASSGNRVTTAGGPIAVAPAADAFVRDWTYASINYGTATELNVKLDGASYQRESFLKFNVSGFAKAGSAKLQLMPVVAGTDTNVTYTVEFVSNDTWTESGITWNTKPAGSGVVLATLSGAAMQVGVPVVVDITNQVKTEAAGDGVISIRIRSDLPGDNHFITFSSKEDVTANRPQLLIQ